MTCSPNPDMTLDTALCDAGLDQLGAMRRVRVGRAISSSTVMADLVPADLTAVRRRSSGSTDMTQHNSSRARLVGLTFVFLWFFIGGIAHFVATETEMRIVPPYIPWAWSAVIVSAVFELLGAAGILWQPTRRYAGLCLMALTVAVTPANIYMLQEPELFALPIWALWLRLPIQVGLLVVIWWSTARPSKR